MPRVGASEPGPSNAMCRNEVSSALVAGREKKQVNMQCKRRLRNNNSARIYRLGRMECIFTVFCCSRPPFRDLQRVGPPTSSVSEIARDWVEQRRPLQVAASLPAAARAGKSAARHSEEWHQVLMVQMLTEGVTHSEFIIRLFPVGGRRSR